MSKRVLAGWLIAMVTVAFGGSAVAQSIHIPGVGRLRAPSELRAPLRALGEAAREADRQSPPQPCGSRDRRRFPQDCRNDGRAITGAVPAPPVVSAADLEPVPGLVLPVQNGAVKLRVSASPGSMRYAVQAGYAWSNGDGVPQNLDQGLAWFREADRLQRVQNDTSLSEGIAEMLRIYGWTDVLLLLQKGQIYSSDPVIATFFYGRAAALNDVQGMAALGYTYEQRHNPTMQAYWCRKAYRTARDTGFREFEIDAVNYFCAPETFVDLVAPSEVAMNRTSNARAQASSDAIRHDVEAMNEFARAFAASAQSTPEDRHSSSAEGHMDHQIERNIRRDCIASGSTMC